jgi:hypothetical protein
MGYSLGTILESYLISAFRIWVAFLSVTFKQVELSRVVF